MLTIEKLYFKQIKAYIISQVIILKYNVLHFNYMKKITYCMILITP